MDRRDLARMRAGQPRGDPGTEVAAMGGVTPVAEHAGHDRVPQLGDLRIGQATGRWWPGEAEAGQGGQHDGEGVRRVAAVRGRVGEQRQQRQVLQERTRPAVGQHQRQRVRPGAGRVHQVHGDPVDLGPQVGEPVQPGLQGQRVEGPPVLDQPGQPVPGHAALPGTVARARPGPAQPGGAQPQGQIPRCLDVQRRPERFGAGMRRAHAEIMSHPPSRVPAAPRGQVTQAGDVPDAIRLTAQSNSQVILAPTMSKRYLSHTRAVRFGDER